MQEILDQNYNKTRLVNILTFNLKRLSLEELKKYLQETAFPEFAYSVKHGTNIRSDYRKLFYGYDLLINGDHEIIQHKKTSQAHLNG